MPPASPRRGPLLTEAELARIAQPTLIAVGTKDDIGGSPDELAGMMPNAESFAIEGRDHMLAVGDKSFKERVVEFLKGASDKAFMILQQSRGLPVGLRDHGRCRNGHAAGLKHSGKHPRIERPAA